MISPPRSLSLAAIAALIASLAAGCTGGAEAPATVTRAAALTAAPGPLPLPRLIVKVRPALDEALLHSSGALTIRKPSDPAALAFFARQAIQSATPVYAGRSALRRRGLSAGSIDSLVRQKFPARSARAPLGLARPDLGGTYTLEILAPDDLKQVLARLRSDPDVVWAETDKPMKASFTPNDPRYDELWGVKRIGSAAAWDTARGQGTLVAVIDTGVDYTHPDINDNVWINSGEVAGNGIDDDGNGFIDDVRGWDFVGRDAGAPVPDNDPADVFGHGTHVAGTIAAEGNNAVGVIGVAFAARVMIVRAFDDGGSAFDSTLASAIAYATDEGADVINASWGREGTSATITDAIDYAYSHGVVVVAAAGNDTRDTSSFYPAHLPHVVTVAATDSGDAPAGFSNFGSKLDLAAPGVDVLSLQAGTGDYVLMSGTSMAAPHVSGVAALVIGRHPTFTVEQVRQVLRTSAVDLGAAGKDDHFGYGLVSASAGVLVGSALASKITGPEDGPIINAPLAITGTAGGPGFARYTLERGAGVSPTSWTTLATSTAAVVEGTLGTFDPGSLADGVYTVRLRAVDSGGKTFSDQIRLQVRYAFITSPPSVPPDLTAVIKPGPPIDIVGRAGGPAFQRFQVEWAPGRDATSGFSATGVTLVGNGTSPITDARLASWTPPSGAAGPYTLRLTVTNSGFSSVATSVVYLEPALVSSTWPVLVPQDDPSASPLPARGADGAVRLIQCGFDASQHLDVCRSYSSDGALVGTLNLSYQLEFQPCAGDVDGQPGDEVVIPDGPNLRILTPDLTLVRTITTSRQETFSVDRLSLSDLDHDGVLEIVAPSRADVGGGFHGPRGSLYVYRGNGQLFSPSYPLTISPPDGSATYLTAQVVTVDLDGDARKELVLGLLNFDENQTTVQALRADGTPYPAFQALPIDSRGVGALLVADLEHDGHPEVIVPVGLVSNFMQVWVLEADGSLRPGQWPALVRPGAIAIGDIDRDGRHELVVGTDQGLAALRDDGGRDFFGLPSDHRINSPLIADIDGDGRPEIVGYGVRLVTAPDGTRSQDTGVEAYAPDGTLVRRWPTFGLDGQPPTYGAITIGELTGDGRTDLAVNTPIGDFFLIGGALEVLTTGATFDPAGADWTTAFGDPQGSATAQPTRTVTFGAAADSYVRDGSASAGKNFGTASSLLVDTGSTGNNCITYVRFPLTGVTPSIGSARLRLFGTATGTTSVTVSAFAVSSNSWSETAITWNNKPALGAKQGAGLVMAEAIERYYDWDVTAFVRAQKAAGATAVSLAVKMDANPNLPPFSFNSRETQVSVPQLAILPAGDSPPTVATAAAASPNPVTGTTAALSVQGADDQGEGALTYTWSATPATVTFSANGSNAAKNSTATFSAAGSYNLQVVIRDAAGRLAISAVNVVVTASSGSATIGPSADAYVRDGTSATQNFGGDPSLAVKTTTASNATRLSYLRFPLAAVSGTVTGAKLRLFGNRSTATAATDAAFAVASNSWTESGINWNNRPTLGAKQGTSVTVGTAAQYWEWNVSTFVHDQKAAGATEVSLAVKMDTAVTDSPDTFHSKEATASPPQLQVTWVRDRSPHQPEPGQPDVRR